MMKLYKLFMLLLVLLFLTGGLVCADEGIAVKEDTTESTGSDQQSNNEQLLLTMIGNNKVIADTLWVLLAAMLVFFMNLGFGMVETGLQQAKNAVNVSAKNFVVFSIAALGFWFIGWGLMYGDGNGFLGIEGLFMLKGADNSPATNEAYSGVYSALSWTGVPLLAKFFFQLVFAGTAATIVSGSVGGRIKFTAFIIFSLVLAGILYPITGHWIWGGGWLAQRGFFDFAGSTVVHSVGGWAALAGALVLGPRIGKYNKDKSVNPIPGHSLTLATLGVFVLWLGWFGFNPGSTMAADPVSISHICITTNMAAVAGTLAATVTSWILLGKPDLSMILNGSLAGLVAITAGCAFVNIESALIIGAIAGIFVVVFVIAFDKWGIDDPVGATSVHLINGIWGTLAVGLFASAPFAGGEGQPALGLFFGGGIGLLANQVVGIVTVGVFTFAISWILWVVLKSTIGIRVHRQEELRGLDISEHGMEAYPDFQSFTLK
ncbi:MAG: ammonium transporter [Spirochaetales bacterium]|nr:ammonium transporter [Spirochaetales bacterium]